MDRAAIAREMEEARARLHALLAAADDADLRRRSNGTCWTNEQLLFHMVFGYLVVRRLLPLVRVVSRLPPPVGRGWAAPPPPDHFSCTQEALVRPRTRRMRLPM